MLDKRTLSYIPIDQIERNPDNPRIVFRQEDLDNLFSSIKKIDVQVPISVYKERGKFILIDGERRLIACKKLNYIKIPAIVQEKPSKLDNLLLMFNIHALREQWDIYTISMKLPEVIKNFKKERGFTPNESELSAESGLSRGTIRRCKMIIDLPSRYKDVILNELNKPKGKQKFTEDFFLEMENSLKSVKKRFPRLLEDNKIDDVRDILIFKYENNIIKSVTEFRKLTKIATSTRNVEYSGYDARKAIKRVFSDNDIGIESVFLETVGTLYDERKFVSNANNLLHFIETLDKDEIENDDIRTTLLKIKRAIERFLRNGE